MLKTLFVVAILTLHQNANAAQTETETSIPVVVELLIVCDKEFGDRFQQERQLIVDYWATYMWDVNMRFKTLPSVDISFRVTSLVSISDAADQPFIEESRTTNGSVKMEPALFKFAEWLYVHEANFTAFDIAVLITGSEVLEKDFGRKGFIKSACQKSATEKRHLSTVLLDANFAWGHSCAVLERALATQLGAALDSTKGFDPSCTTHNYLMGSRQCDEMKYFFSNCSDRAIAQYLSSKEASCLHSLNDTAPDILKNESSVKHPPSLTEQCELFTDNSNAILVENDEENQCVVADCQAYDTNENLNYTTTIYPVDNTPCGIDMFCFRGRCLTMGYQLEHEKSGLCLHSRDRFASDDEPKLGNCSSSPTPLDRFIFGDKGNLGLYLITPYSTPFAEESGDKCLHLKEGTEKVQYTKCSLEENSNFLGWTLQQTEDDSAFLVRHEHTQNCLKIEEDLSIRATNSCDEADISLRWRFNDQNLQPLRFPQEVVESTTMSGDEDEEDDSAESFSDKMTLRGWIMSVAFLVIGIAIGVMIILAFQAIKNRKDINFPFRFDSCSKVLYDRDADVSYLS